MQLRTLNKHDVRAARKLRRRGFSLIEVVVALAVAGVFIAGMVTGYIEVAKQAEWSAYSLSANAMALQQIEKVKSAKWDPNGYPPVDQVVAANFPVSVEILDVPVTKTNTVYATNTVTITVISTVPPLKMVQATCVWPFLNRGKFTNTVVTYRAPDQ
jgi:prepilin-type N-terminal cleavage/methylation domain-containing protein